MTLASESFSVVKTSVSEALASWTAWAVPEWLLGRKPAEAMARRDRALSAGWQGAWVFREQWRASLAPGCSPPRISMKSRDDSCFYPLFLGRPHFIASFLQLIQWATVLDNCSADTNNDKDRYGLHHKIKSTSTHEQGVSQAWLRDKQVP